MQYKRTLARTLPRLAAVVAVSCGFTLATPAAAAAPSDLFKRHNPGSQVEIDHSDWDGLLKTYVVTDPTGLNRVDYSRFKNDGHPQLKSYLAKIQAVDVAQLRRSEQFALLANLYNAKTIDVVLDAFPIKSIKDINLGGGLLSVVTGGPWKAKVIRLNGADLSLDDIEHGILRPVFKDPRVHYAVNCASVGCPNLQREAFTGRALDAQLDAAARAYVNSARGFRLENGKLAASSIYSWFKDDFGGSDKGVLAHAARYAEAQLALMLHRTRSIDEFYYDWSLNGVEPAQGASRRALR